MVDASPRSNSTLLGSALRHLTDAGLHVAEVADARDGDTSFDTLLRVSGPAGTGLYEVQLKSRVSPASATTVRPPTHGRRLLIVAAYVSESIAEFWRHQDVHYVDSAGNMYLRWEGLLLDIRGRRQPAAPQPAEPGRPLRAFRSSGLKILFVLLAVPSIITANYRDIAHASGTSLGTVQWVLKELDETGYVSPGPHKRQLRRARDLFSRWVEAYTLDLFPRLTLGRFDSPDPTWWTNADEAMDNEEAQWGGETAAHRLNPHLRPGRAIIYASAVPKRLAVNYRFHKAAGQGSIEVRERFWHFTDEAPSRTVPTPLVYADLIASADPRQLEAADYLRENDALLRRLNHS